MLNHIFSLRGHKAGVTALHQFETYLLSGDEEGSLMIWNLDILRKQSLYENMFQSRIQSIKSFKITNKLFIMVQSRDHGIHIFPSNNIIDQSEKVSILAQFSSYPSIFSKADAINHSSMGPLLAYPNDKDKFLVTVTFLAEDLSVKNTEVLGRSQSGGAVFDIKLQSKEDQIYVYVGYEDGQIGLFSSIQRDNDKTEIRFVNLKTINIDVGDFVSALDVSLSSLLIVGSPSKELLLYDCKTDETCRVKLKKRGISSLKIDPTGCLVAVATWSCQVDIYHLNSRTKADSLLVHNKQVQDILWLSVGNLFPQYDNALCCASLDGTISIVGTIK